MVPWWGWSILMCAFLLIGWALGAYQMYQVMKKRR